MALDDSGIAAATRPLAGETSRDGIAATPDRSDRGVASDAATYAGGVYAAQILLFAAGLIQKGLMGPTGAGYWALMATIYSFFGLASFGIFHGAIRQVPAYRGVGDYRSASSTADTANTVLVLAVAVLGGVVALVALLVGGGWAPEIRYGLVLLGATAPLRALTDAHELLFQVTKRFSVLARTLVLRAAVALTIQSLLVYFLGFYGMFAGLVAGILASFAYWNRQGLAAPAARAFGWQVSRSRIGELMGVGLPIMIYSQLWLLFWSVDNLVVARFVDVTNLGYYALAVSVTSYVMLLPNSIATTMFPRMQERFARAEMTELRHSVLAVQHVLGLVLVPVLVAVVFFTVPLLVRQALSSFEPAVAVVEIMVAASFLLALAQMPIEFLITTNRRWQATWLMLACLAVNLVANLVAVVVLDRGIRGAAFATGVSYGVLFVAGTTCSLLRHVDGSALARHLFGLLAVVAYTVGVLWGIEAIVGHGRTIGTDVLLGGVKLGIALLLLAPLLLAAERRLKALTILQGLLTSRLRPGRAG